MYNNVNDALSALNTLSFDGLTTVQAKQSMLLEYVQQLSIEAQGRITVLYSGKTASVGWASAHHRGIKYTVG